MRTVALLLKEGYHSSALYIIVRAVGVRLTHIDPFLRLDNRRRRERPLQAKRTNHEQIMHRAVDSRSIAMDVLLLLGKGVDSCTACLLY